jgi:S-DNA-T family DNA segregation ATPase FtsK/SpoIIIE
MRSARLVLLAALLMLVLAVISVVLRYQARDASHDLIAAVFVAAALMLTGYAAWVFPKAGLWFEYKLRWRFKQVCEQKGLVKKYTGGGLFRADVERLAHPGLSELVGDRQSFSGRVRPLLGQSVADWERSAPAFAVAFGVPGTRIRGEGNGTVSLLVGYKPMAAQDIAPSDAAPLVLAPGMTWRQWLQRVDIGNREGGGRFGLPLLDSHVLIAGITNAGKGSWIWSPVLRLVPAYRAGVVRFWGFDPKRIELAIGRPLFGDYYANDPLSVVQLLELAHAEMERTADRLAGYQRRFEPSSDYPLNVLVIDELGYLSALLPDRKLRERAEHLMQGILVLGRALGFSVIGTLQDPRKETVGFRDLFPTRVAMRLSKPMVDLVLGAGMYEAGAKCDLIPQGEAGAGAAFVVDEGSTLPVCVRADWSSDEAIRAAVADAVRMLPPQGAASVRKLQAVS